MERSPGTYAPDRSATGCLGMCTVSAITLTGPSRTLRVVSSRDESRLRPPAAPPRWHPVHGRREGRAIWPVDTLAGGTWIAAAEHGLVLCVLNFNQDIGPGEIPNDTMSRGMVIPALIGQPGVSAASEALGKLPLERALPFRLIAIEPGAEPAGPTAIESIWDGRTLRTSPTRVGPVCFASSGLGDHLVQERVPLFQSMLAALGATAAMQDEFHAHQWPDRPELSVRMSRVDARTVSVCAAEVTPLAPGAARVAMHYTPIEAGAGELASA